MIKSYSRRTKQPNASDSLPIALRLRLDLLRRRPNRGRRELHALQHLLALPRLTRGQHHRAFNRRSLDAHKLFIIFVAQVTGRLTLFDPRVPHHRVGEVLLGDPDRSRTRDVVDGERVGSREVDAVNLLIERYEFISLFASNSLVERIEVRRTLQPRDLRGGGVGTAEVRVKRGGEGHGFDSGVGHFHRCFQVVPRAEHDFVDDDEIVRPLLLGGWGGAQGHLHRRGRARGDLCCRI